jgi:hypothetical protein
VLSLPVFFDFVHKCEACWEGSNVEFVEDDGHLQHVVDRWMEVFDSVFFDSTSISMSSTCLFANTLAA